MIAVEGGLREGYPGSANFVSYVKQSLDASQQAGDAYMLQDLILLVRLILMLKMLFV